MLYLLFLVMNMPISFVVGVVFLTLNYTLTQALLSYSTKAVLLTKEALYGTRLAVQAPQLVDPR